MSGHNIDKSKKLEELAIVNKELVIEEEKEKQDKINLIAKKNYLLK